MANYNVESHTQAYTRHTYLVQNNIVFFYFWHPVLVRPVIFMKSFFFPWNTTERKARFARAPHYYYIPGMYEYITYVEVRRGTASPVGSSVGDRDGDRLRKYRSSPRLSAWKIAKFGVDLGL